MSFRSRFFSGIHVRIEWPTLLLITATYSAWIALVHFHTALHPVLWVLATGAITTIFLSITHEVTHRHPTRFDRINRLLILMPIGWVMPYERFRDTHIAHHETGYLTDPFDDPESWYLEAFSWQNMPLAFRKALEFNNTLFGRMLIGPFLGLGRFYWQEIKLALNDGDLRSYLSTVWLKHAVLCILLAWFVQDVGAWKIICAAYIGVSLLMVRSFLEHQASPDQRECTVIIEGSCPLTLLFLFNNLHVVHHEMPGIPWYKLRHEYKASRDRYIAMNNGYVYSSYAEVFKRYFFTMKEPVIHPISNHQARRV